MRGRLIRQRTAVEEVLAQLGLGCGSGRTGPLRIWLGEREHLLPPAAAADEAMAAANLSDEVQAALLALPAEYRAAVVLCDVVGLGYQEVADTLGIPVGTVRSRIHRGRAQLRKVLL